MPRPWITAAQLPDRRLDNLAGCPHPHSLYKYIDFFLSNRGEETLFPLLVSVIEILIVQRADF